MTDSVIRNPLTRHRFVKQTNSNAFKMNVENRKYHLLLGYRRRSSDLDKWLDRDLKEKQDEEDKGHNNPTAAPWIVQRLRVWSPIGKISIIQHVGSKFQVLYYTSCWRVFIFLPFTCVVLFAFCFDCLSLPWIMWSSWTHVSIQTTIAFFSLSLFLFKF